MSASRQLSRSDELPSVIATLAMSMGKTPIGCVIAIDALYGVGFGDNAELEAVAKFGIKLAEASLYTTRLPDSAVMHFLEKCGLRRMVVLTAPPKDQGRIGMIYIEYAGEALYRLRDMVKVLEETW